MNPWLRVLAVLIAAVVAAFLLQVLPPVIVLVAFVGGVAYVNHLLRSRAGDEARRDTSSVIGLRREEHDPFGLLGYPFALFSRGGEPVVENLAWGTWRGAEVKRFDLTFEPIVEARGVERPRFMCAIAPLHEPGVPHVIVEPWTFVTRLASESDLPQVTVGSERVREMLQVRSSDERFAGSLLDESTARWLLDLDERWGFEASGSIALLYGPAVPGWDVVAVLDVLQGFIDRIPAVGPAAGVPGPEG